MPRGTPVRRLLSERSRSEAGVTIVETVVTMAIFAIALVALLTTMTKAAETTEYARDRNEALDQLRLMTATFSKDVRQGITASAISPDAMTFSTYVNGAIQTVTWRVTGDGEDQRFERLVGGATQVVYVLDLTNDAVLSYFGVLDPTAVHRVRLSLETQPDPRHPPIQVATVVEMRNAT